jgi:EPS-associated MarR family transcriptional regulator
MTDEVRYRLLCCVEQHPYASQREMARHLGVSVGTVNYCLRALIEKGSLKVRNFRKSKSKLSYAYVLTPKGIQEKVEVTYQFLRRKIEEYTTLTAEIERLKQEVEQCAPARRK